MTLKKIKASYNSNTLIGKKETEAFEILIAELISDFLNPEIPISRTSEKANCKKCYFNTVCHIQDDKAEDIAGYP